ncbi:hypothetical protein ABIF39_000315 [Bradyrhizobium diazoefficiens]
MESHGIAHRGLAHRDVGMHRERRLHVSERRDDDAPDALDRVERQDAAMALHDPPHHVGLARRPERRAHLLGLLHLDQAVDDVAALHQEAMHALVDRVDLLAQFLQRWWRGRTLGHIWQVLLRGVPMRVHQVGPAAVDVLIRQSERRKQREMQREIGPFRLTRRGRIWSIRTVS